MSKSAQRPRVLRALHADQVFDMVAEHCRTAVDVRTLHHIAHYSYGILNLSADVLDDEELTSRLAGRLTVDRSRRDLENFGRQLHYIMRDVAETLEQLRSGRLIRAVFDVRVGAFYFFEILPCEYLVGVTFDGSAIVASDLAMAKTVQRIRAHLKLGDTNPGGFNPLPGNGAPVPSGDPVVERCSTPAEADDSFIASASAAVRPQDLHFVARFEQGAWRCSVDVLGDRSLDPFFLSITRKRRRDLYQSIGRQFHAVSTTIDAALRGVAGKRTTDVIFDVEAGAIYFRRIRPDTYIMGVTLDQSQVRETQLRFTALAD